MVKKNIRYTLLRRTKTKKSKAKDNENRHAYFLVIDLADATNSIAFLLLSAAETKDCYPFHPP